MRKYIVLRQSKSLGAPDLVTIEKAENDFALELKLKGELVGKRDVLGVEYMPLREFIKGGLLCGTWIGIAWLEKIREEKE